MSTGFLGFSNLYLKLGGLLLLASILLLAWTWLVPDPGEFTGFVAGYLLASGLVLYVVGRIVKVVRSRRQA